MERSGFFDAQLTDAGYDRVYQALDFSKLFSLFFTDGVFINPADSLQVIAKEGLTVTVKAGKAFIEGYWYELTENMDVVLSPNTGSYRASRLIVCQLNRVERKIFITSRESTSSLTPVNNENIHELILAQVYLNVGASSITNTDIVDLRADKRYCGFVKGTVDEIDTTDLFIQFESQFNIWFEEIKGTLNEDTAGNLLNKIMDLQAKVDNLPTIYSGVNDPDDSVGKDGDIYIKLIE